MTAVPKPSRRDRLEAARRKREAAILARAELRYDTFVRSGGRCEACGAALPGGFELHHLVSGSGRRRQQESLASCIALCLACHRSAHAGDPNTLRALHLWASAYGNSTARLETTRRLAKAETMQQRFAAAVRQSRRTG